MVGAIYAPIYSSKLWAIFWAVLILNAAIWAVYSGLYIYFSRTDPDRLQSEDFQLKQRGLDIIGEKGKDFSPDAISSIQEISKPVERPPK